jgi:hypothetical protein
MAEPIEEKAKVHGAAEVQQPPSLESIRTELEAQRAAAEQERKQAEARLAKIEALLSNFESIKRREKNLTSVPYVPVTPKVGQESSNAAAVGDGDAYPTVDPMGKADETDAKADEEPDYSEYLAKLLKKPRQESPQESPSEGRARFAPGVEAKSRNIAVEVGRGAASGTTDRASTHTAETDAAGQHSANSKTTEALKTGAPVDLAAILRKQGFSLDDDASQAAESEKMPLRKPRGSLEPSPRTMNGAEPQSKQTDVEPARAKPTSGNEEESIDDYMSKLLARVRGSDAPDAPPVVSGPGKSAGPTPAARRAAHHAAAKAAAKALSETDPAPAIRPGEMAPRTLAPEKNINLSAIREIANLSASSALSSHQQKTTAINSQAKLLVTSVAFVMGVVFVIVWRMPHASPYTLLLALVSFGVSAIWGVQFSILLSKQLVERAARFERHLKRTNEAAGEAAALAAGGKEAGTA